MPARCINIDWLEVHCLESKAMNADYFKQLGWQVSVREYGTRVYKEMFTLYTPDNQPFIEVRRAPATSTEAAKFFEPNSVHLRLHNRTCYIKGCAKLLDEFIHTYNYEFRRISRIDIALDFEKFDSGDEPGKFLLRYLKGKYSKVNQANIRAAGKDEWDGRSWNSVSWGSKRSQIVTKMYCKTLELREAKDKPYIRQAWAAAGLVADMIKLNAFDADGHEYKPDIWRIEFSINSSVKNWFVMDIDENGHSCKRSVRNTLNEYYSDIQLLNIFDSLSRHYFHFKHFETNVRKDRCKDKELFHFGTLEQFYQIDRVATAKPADNALHSLLKRLQKYKMEHYNAEGVRAANMLINIIEDEIKKEAQNVALQDTELQILRRLIAYRCESPEIPIAHDLEFIRALYNLENEIF